MSDTGEVTQMCMAGLPPTRELVGLKVPYGAWEADTLITDTFGNPMFSVLDVQHHAMGSYEAIFGDENGHKLCYVKRRLITKYWKDGWDFCTYKPNFPGQPKYKERDMYGKSVYPFSFLQIRPMRTRYNYSIHQDDMESMDLHLQAMHGWLGATTVCCTPIVRFGKWQIDFHRPGVGDPELNLDQSKNLLEVERGNDLLAALCIAYAFDKALCQPLVTIIGYQEKEHMDDDDDTLDSYEQAGRGVGAAGAGGYHDDDYDDDDDDNNRRRDRGGEYSDDPEYDEDQNQGQRGRDMDYDEQGNYIGYDDTYANQSEDPSKISGYLAAEPYDGSTSGERSNTNPSQPESQRSSSNEPYYSDNYDSNSDQRGFQDEPNGRY